MTAFLAVRDIRLRLGSFMLGSLSIELERGAYVVLLGPSGCGKTTLLKALAGIHRLDEGTVTLDGRDVTALPPQRREVGYVPQAATLFPHLDVKANISFGLRYVKLTQAERKERFDSIVFLLQVGHLLDRRTGALSGGESKRVALARSLVMRPSLLLLDEPLGMLDHNARSDMVESLRNVSMQTGTTTIHVTHDREEAWSLKGICAVMGSGKIHQSGNLDEVFRKPSDRFTAEFLGGENIFEAEFSREEGEWYADLGWAKLPVSHQPDSAKGLLLVRPENFAVAVGEDAAVKGILADITDRGVYTGLKVEVARSVYITVHIPSGEAKGLSLGKEIFLDCRIPAHPLSEEVNTDG